MKAEQKFGWRITALVVGILFSTSLQSCASKSEAQMYLDQLETSESEANAINNSLFFKTNSVTLQVGAKQLVAYGVCPTSNVPIYWQVYQEFNGGGYQMVEGYTNCDTQEFNVDLSNVTSLFGCGQTYNLVVTQGVPHAVLSITTSSCGGTSASK